MAKKARVDWDKYYVISSFIPHEIIGDKETGLMRLATSREAFEKFLEVSKGRTISKEKLTKYYDYQKVIFLDEEEFFTLNPEYWRALGLEKQD